MQDTEHAEEILGRSTNTRHAEEAVDLVASSSSQCAEGSKERVAEPGSCAENVLKKFKRSCRGQKSAELLGQSSPSKLRVQQMPPPSCALIKCVWLRRWHRVQKNRRDREQNKRKGIRETKPRPSLKRHERASYDTEPHLEPGFLVAYSRKPGMDIKRWTYFGDKQPME